MELRAAAIVCSCMRRPGSVEVKLISGEVSNSRVGLGSILSFFLSIKLFQKIEVKMLSFYSDVVLDGASIEKNSRCPITQSRLFTVRTTNSYLLIDHEIIWLNVFFPNGESSFILFYFI